MLMINYKQENCWLLKDIVTFILNKFPLFTERIEQYEIRLRI